MRSTNLLLLLLLLTPAAPSAMIIYERQAAARSGRWRRNWSRRYTLCSDLNSNQSGQVTLTSDLLTLKVVSESHVTWATSLPILVFLGLSVLDLGSMYATDVRRHTKASLNASAY